MQIITVIMQGYVCILSSIGLWIDIFLSNVPCLWNTEMHISLCMLLLVIIDSTPACHRICLKELLYHRCFPCCTVSFFYTVESAKRNLHPYVVVYWLYTSHIFSLSWQVCNISQKERTLLMPCQIFAEARGRVSFFQLWWSL
jgi:hypothetical protein